MQCCRPQPQSVHACGPIRRTRCLAASAGSSSINPGTGQPYGIEFPFVTILDMVRAQKLLIDHLGIQRLFAVKGRDAAKAQRSIDELKAGARVATASRDKTVCLWSL